jgi:hypothetical protein
MRTAIAAALQDWAELENEFARVLHYLLEHSDPELGLVIYYVPSNTETRIAIVDAVLQEKVHRFCPYADEIIRCWGKFLEQVNRSKKTRNKIAHGNAILVTQTNSGKTQARLVPPLLDPINRRKTWKGDQFPGMATHDVAAAARKIVEHRKTLRMIFDLIKLVRSTPFDWRASQEKLRELEKRLNLAPAQSGDRIPPAHEAPPESSQA